MLKLREPFSQKVHLHIRQDMLQRLWDQYVPTSSPVYGQIELVYLKDVLGDMEKQPEQIQLLLHLILKNKKMQLNLMQYPVLVKICQKQLASSLRRMEQHYGVQLKCSNFTMYRTVRQYFTLLEQAQEDGRRYQEWQKNYQEIEKQKDEIRLLSLFSEKLRDYFTEYPVNTLRMMEQEFVTSLSETEYQTLAEELIWQEKPELLAYFKECEKVQCKEIVKALEKDTDMRQILSSIQKQSAKKKLVAAAYKLEQKEFSRFYWQVVEQKDVNPQIVIWKKDRTEMLRLIDELELESLQKVWAQIETVSSVEGSKYVFTEKMLHIQNQYQQNKSTDFQEQISVILKENALENIVDIEQLLQDVSIDEYIENPVGNTEEAELEFLESEPFVLWDGAYQVIQNLEREQEIRQERIEQQQAQVVETFREAYRQILSTESILDGQQKDNTAQYAAQIALQIFRKQYQEQLTGEEIQNICEWSQTLLEVYFAEQERTEDKKEIISSFSFNQEEQLELTYVVEKINHYIKEQHGLEEVLILHRQEETLKDERIKKLLTYVRDLEEEQRDKFIYYLADMVQLSVQLSSQRKLSTAMQPSGTETTVLPIQGNNQETVKKLLRIEDREFAEKLLQIEDKELAERLLQIEDRELAERLLQIEDRELAEKLLQIEDREFVTKLLQNSDRQLPDVSYRNLWEWGETLLFHPEHQQEWEDADILEYPQQEVFSSDEAKQEDAQTQVIRRQIEMAKDRNRLQSLIRQINHQADIQLVYKDIQLRLPQVQTLLHYIQQLDEEQYGVFVKELVQIIKIQKLSNEEPEEAVAVPIGEENNLSGTRETNAVILHSKTSSTEQRIQGNAYETAEKMLRIEEDKKFIEKLLQLEDRGFAKTLLQLEDREFAERLLQLENGEFAKTLLQLEDREFVEKLLRIENREFAEKMLRIENKELAKKLLQLENREFLEKLLQNNNIQSQDVSYKNLWEWGEALLLHPEYQSEQKASDIKSSPQQEVLSSEESQQENEQTQMTRQQIEIGKDRKHLQSLIGQMNHRADVQLEYADVQLRMPQIQTLLHYIRQLDVKQYGVFVKELAQVTMIQKRSYDEPEAAAHTREVSTLSGTRTVSLEQRMISYPILARDIQIYEKQRRSELYRNIRKIEQKIFPQSYEKENRQSVTSNSDAGDYAQGTAAYGLAPYQTSINDGSLVPYEASISDDSLASYQTIINEYALMPYEGREPTYESMSYDTGIDENDLTLYEGTQKEYAQITTYERNQWEIRYQSQELEYSVQKASISEEDQQRKEQRMQQENAQIKSMQEQLDNKLKEVEHQLKKVEDSTKAKEDVRTFAEQVKQQLYEELHVEKLRRGLI